MENKRRKIHEELEVVQVGFANGVAPGFPLDDKAKAKMIEKAAKAYGQFLTAFINFIKCYVDNQLYHTVSNSTSLPFNQNFFLIINCAMGGNFGGAIASNLSNNSLSGLVPVKHNNFLSLFL